MNPPPYYFFSYARTDGVDNEPLLARFLADIEAEVRALTGIRDNSRGFRDVTRIDLGQPWPDALGQALQHSRVFLALYSPAYFTSPNCGQEWTAFAQRCREHAQATNSTAPPLIVPVLWMPVTLTNYPLSSEIGTVQYHRAAFGDVYRDKGLRFLLRFHLNDLYPHFVAEFGKCLVELVEQHNLRPCSVLPDIRTLASAFHCTPTPTKLPALTPPRESGLRHVKFVILAGAADELHGIRKHTDAYAGSNLGWLPYLPDCQRELAVLVQEVAASEGFSSAFIDPGVGFLEQLQLTQARRNLLVVLVDPWSLRLQLYRHCAGQYDERDFWNGTVLIPWNGQDAETCEHEQSLLELIDEAFPNKATGHKIAGGKSWAFRGTVSTAKLLAQKLREVLRRIKTTLIKTAPAPRKVAGARDVALPILSGPGGKTP